MKLGTKSLLFGGHQFIIHPIAVAIAWRKLYGSWPRDWRYYLVFIVHDWGYWGLDNMDGVQGKTHPIKGASLAAKIICFFMWTTKEEEVIDNYLHWFKFSLGHSRYMAKYLTISVSPLAAADKLATAILPLWLMVIMFGATGEWREYLAYWQRVGNYPGEPNLVSYCRTIKADWQRFEDVNTSMEV